MSALRFEWDPAKATANLHKHGVTFDEAVTVFADPNAWFEDDPRHSDGEDRQKVIGFSIKPRLLVVIFTERNHAIRLINARKTTAAEETAYAQNLD